MFSVESNSTSNSVCSLIGFFDVLDWSCFVHGMSIMCQNKHRLLYVKFDGWIIGKEMDPLYYKGHAHDQEIYTVARKVTGLQSCQEF